jgi:hypothetical protein
MRSTWEVLTKCQNFIVRRAIELPARRRLIDVYFIIADRELAGPMPRALPFLGELCGKGYDRSQNRAWRVR